MGYLMQKHGINMLGKTPEGTCPECATKHLPEHPHNQQSLAYQYKFYDENGRWPTWDDAMKHCTEEMKTRWKEELTKAGVKFN